MESDEMTQVESFGRTRAVSSKITQVEADETTLAELYGMATVEPNRMSKVESNEMSRVKLDAMTGMESNEVSQVELVEMTQVEIESSEMGQMETTEMVPVELGDSEMVKAELDGLTQVELCQVHKQEADDQDRVQVETGELTMMVQHKMERDAFQYLVVDSDTFHRWRSVGRSLSLPTDSKIAAFLLQHYEKLQCPQLTECVKCCGPLTQYCIKCNIYVGQPLTPPPSLPADSASLRASWDSQHDGASLVASQDDSSDRASWDNLSNRVSQYNSVAGKTVPVNTADSQTDQSQLHQVISVQVDGTADRLTKGEKGTAVASGSFDILMKACAMEGLVAMEDSAPPKKGYPTPESHSGAKTVLIPVSAKASLKSKSASGPHHPQPPPLAAKSVPIPVPSRVPGTAKFVLIPKGDKAPLTAQPALIPVNPQQPPAAAKARPVTKSLLTPETLIRAKTQLGAQSQPAASVKTDGVKLVTPSKSQDAEEHEPSAAGAGDQHGCDDLETPDNETVDSDPEAEAPGNSGSEEGLTTNGASATGTDGAARPSPGRGRQQRDQKLEDQIIIITGQSDSEDELPQPRKRPQRRRQPPQHPRPKAESPGAADLSSQVSVVVDAGTAGVGDGGQRDGEVGRKRRRRRVPHPDVPLKEKVKRIFPCELCGKDMRSKYELEGHLRVHRGDRPFACTHCDASYTRPYHLTVHLRKHARIKPHPCDQCDKAFTTASGLKLHQSCHSTDRPFVCEICGLATKTINNLKYHKRIHDNSVKPHVCPQCGMAFRWRSNFRDHVKIHSNDKTFACPHCDVRYIQSGSLKRHIDRKHVPNRPRPYVCEVCGASRYEKNQFEKHMMIHNNIKPFKCEVCGAAFIQSNALKGHMKIHNETEGKAHWCNVCGAAFKRFASVKVHMKKVHQDVAQDILDLVLPVGDTVEIAQ